MESSQFTDSHLRSELMYEGIIRADGLNIAEPNLFDDINTYARGMLVDSGADLNNEELGNTPDEQVKIYTAMNESLKKLLKTDFLVENQQDEPFKKETKATDEEKKNILFKLDKYNQPFFIEN